MKSNSKIICFVFVLSLSFFVFYFVYNNYLKDNFNNINVENSFSSNMSKKELASIISVIPYDKSSSMEKTKYSAYTNDSVKVSSLNKKLLVQYAISNLNVDSYKDGYPKFEQNSKGIFYKSSKNEAFEAQGYIKFSDVSKYIKENYNIDLKKDDFKNGVSIISAPVCGDIYYESDYFCIFCSTGEVSVEKISFINGSRIKDNKLIIYERVGFLYSDEGVVELYKDNFKKEIIKKQSYKIESDDLNSIKNNFKKYFDSNNKEFNLYKHIFNIKDGKYYYSSTSLEE